MKQPSEGVKSVQETGRENVTTDTCQHKTNKEPDTRLIVKSEVNMPLGPLQLQLEDKVPELKDEIIHIHESNWDNVFMVQISQEGKCIERL